MQESEFMSFMSVYTFATKVSRVVRRRNMPPVDPFFSANKGLTKKIRLPWYCYFDDLSRKSSLKKIETTFRTVLGGQRSKRVFLAKFALFWIIFAFLVIEYALEQVYDVAVSMVFHIIPILKEIKMI